MSLRSQQIAFDLDSCRRKWQECLAPAHGDVRAQLVREASEFFHICEAEVIRRLQNAVDQFADEWRTRHVDPADSASLVRFYNETDTEVFELLEWHATNAIHVRSVICAELARRAPGCKVLDYGSGIGSDALVFGRHGYEVTLADISEPLLAFARYRCERHGLSVRTIDLKRVSPERGAYDVVLCFDVLEHIPDPIATVRILRDALRPGGLLFLHAPFGEDPDRPMHVVHRDVVSPRMRALSFHSRWDLEELFPRDLWAPRVYERVTPRVLDRVGYFLQDVWLPPALGTPLATAYRAIVPRRASGAEPRGRQT